MKNLKIVLAAVLALCLLLSLAAPVFATGETTGAAETTSAAAETTTAAEETTGAAEETTGAAEEYDHDHEEDTATTDESEKESPSVIKIILTVVEVIASIALIVVVMLQSGKESGLSSALSGNSDSYLSKSGKSLDKVLAKATKWVALGWLVLTLVLCLIP